MKRLLALALFVASSLAAQETDVHGRWVGAIALPNGELAIVVTLASADGESWSGTIDIPAQGLSDFALSNVSVQGRRVRFEMGGVPGQPTFEGNVSDSADEIVGMFRQGPQEFSFSLRRSNEPAPLGRPQTPKPPFPYESSEISFPNEAAGIRLAGTLVIPDGAGPLPAVLFVTGSGPQDRDETLMGHKPFHVIADYLGRRGIASLRFDDRGVGASEGKHMESTVGDFASDADAGVRFLSHHPRVARDAIGILGHSEGGLTGPRVATTNAEVDFLVLLAPPGEPVPSLIMRQAGALFRQRGVPEDLIARAMSEQAEDLELLRDAGVTRHEAAEILRARAERRLETYSDSELTALGISESTIEQGIQPATTPWFRSLLREDPGVYLRAIRIPVLALFGQKDLQVAADVNAEAVDAMLAAAGNRDYEVCVLPDLNHLFQHAETGGLEEYASIEETFAPEALEIIGDWIEARIVR